jgi:hypothetical protein
MSDPIPVDAAAAHRRFAPVCFNRAWELLDKADRSDAENEELLVIAHASLWHWLQRPEATKENLSVGHWLVSRVSSVCGLTDSAVLHAQRAIGFSESLSPFYRAYAYEALARAFSSLPQSTSRTGRSPVSAEDALRTAKEFARTVTDPEEQKLLTSDLKAVETLIVS